MTSNCPQASTFGLSKTLVYTGNFHGPKATTTKHKILLLILLLLQVITAVHIFLLRSGDIEMNPGPGRYPGKTLVCVSSIWDKCIMHVKKKLGDYGGQLIFL